MLIRLEEWPNGQLWVNPVYALESVKIVQNDPRIPMVELTIRFTSGKSESATVPIEAAERMVKQLERGRAVEVQWYDRPGGPNNG